MRMANNSRELRLDFRRRLADTHQLRVLNNFPRAEISCVGVDIAGSPTGQQLPIMTVGHSGWRAVGAPIKMNT
jgi:hypothetical protein